MTIENFVQFVEKDEGRHPATDETLWQESVLLHWYDEAQGIGGWHRVGHEPNNAGGRAAIWSYVFSAAGGWQYRRCGDVALSKGDVYANGFGAADALRFNYENDAAVWRVKDGPLEAQIECRNLFPLVDPFPKNDAVAAKRFAHHFEVAGRMSGTVSYRGKSVAVKGYGYRDHSWSIRDWQKGMLNHRWFTGTLGDQLSFAAITAQSSEGKLTRVGYIARKGNIERTQDIDVIPYMEPDGMTHRGGYLSMVLQSGERIHITCKPVAGVAFQRGSVVMVEMMCTAEGHGLRGYCDAEISSNPRNGAGPVLLSLNATMQEGFSDYKPLQFS